MQLMENEQFTENCLFCAEKHYNIVAFMLSELLPGTPNTAKTLVKRHLKIVGESLPTGTGIASYISIGGRQMTKQINPVGQYLDETATNCIVVVESDDTVKLHRVVAERNGQTHIISKATNYRKVTIRWSLAYIKLRKGIIY